MEHSASAANEYSMFVSDQTLVLYRMLCVPIEIFTEVCNEWRMHIILGENFW